MLQRALAPALVAVALALGASATAGADELVRITDIAPDAADGLDGLRAAAVGGVLYFVADPGTGGPALYAWNGVDAPQQVAGSQGTDPDELVAFDGKLYFQGGPSNDRELWVYDPSGPTIEEALDVRPGGNGAPQSFAVAGGQLCFGANTDALGFELHCWDGVGAVDVLNLRAGADSSFPRELLAWGSLLAFVADPGSGDAVMTYDFAVAPEVVEADPGEPFLGACCLSVAGAELTFQAEAEDQSDRVWRYDGVDPPTRVSTTFEPWGYLGSFRNRLVVDGEDPSLGVPPSELWRDTPAGLRRVDAGAPAVAGEGYVTAADGLYFSGFASTGSNDPLLFRYCGAGPVEPAHPLLASLDVELTALRPVVFSGRVLIAAETPDFGEELWAVVPSHIFCDSFESGDLSSW